MGNLGLNNLDGRGILLPADLAPEGFGDLNVVSFCIRMTLYNWLDWN